MKLLRWFGEWSAVELSRNTVNFLILSFTAFALSLLLPTAFIELLSPMLYNHGEVANFTVRAPRDFLIEDSLSTEKRRAQAVAEIKPVFNITEPKKEDVSKQLEAIFAALREGPASESGRTKNTRQARSDFERQFNLDLRGQEWTVILDSTNWGPLEDAIVPVVFPIVRKGVIASKRPLEDVLEREGTAVLKDLNNGAEKELASGSEIYSHREALETALTSLPHQGSGRGAEFDSVVRKLITVLVQPNVTYDMVTTEERLRQAAAGVEPVFYRIKRGEVIVRAGDVISPSQERRLKQLREDIRPEDVFRDWAGFFLLSLTALLGIYSFVTSFIKEFQPAPKDMVLIAGGLVGSFCAIKLFSALATSQSTLFFYLDPAAFVLATPLAAGGIILQVTLGAPAVLMFVLSFAVLSGVYLESSWLVMVLIVIGNFVAAVSLRRCSRRSAFIWAATRVALANMLVVLCFLLLHPEFSGPERASRILWAICGGLLSGVLAAGLTPIAEFLGRYVTDIKLLELASLDHPLLRDLSLQAPGTWNHSIVMGQMSEVAAEAIGANPLLARVGAYYHDIGKAKMPAYFVENQTKENRHDKLTPTMSALIIKKHVKDGIEMAERENLPRAIIDFISQHHGTSLIEYFYEKAQKEADGEEEVSETSFRYAGPKPQSKEAAILMLADAVEASSRTLSDPSPAKIQGLVQKMINKVFAGGQLDESNLTLQDLHLIAKSFTRVLSGIHHRRVEYSEPAEKIRESRVKPKNGGSAEQEQNEGPKVEAIELAAKRKNGGNGAGEADGSAASGDGTSKKADSSSSKEALKRLGI